MVVSNAACFYRKFYDENIRHLLVSNAVINVALYNEYYDI